MTGQHSAPTFERLSMLAQLLFTAPMQVFTSRPKCQTTLPHDALWYDASQALQSATNVAAEVMGLGYEVGKIEAGYAADFVVEGNPIEQIGLLEAPSAVIKGGVRYR